MPTPLPEIQIELFTQLAIFFNGFIIHILRIYKKVASHVLPLNVSHSCFSVFHETPYLASTCSIIRPSGSSLLETRISRCGLGHPPFTLLPTEVPREGGVVGN